MILKAIEIRDRFTFIPAVAIRMIAANERQRHMMACIGFHGQGVVLMRLHDQRAAADPHEWGGRTMPTAHEWLIQHFDEVSDGQVIDVEYILGETPEPKPPDS